MGRSFPQYSRPINKYRLTKEVNSLMSENTNSESTETVEKAAGPTPGTVLDSAQATVSGGIGDVQNPNYPVAGSYQQNSNGPGPTSTFRSDIRPFGQPGGQLPPEASNQFIDYVWDATVLAKDGRKVAMKANTIEIDKINVGERVIRHALQAQADVENAPAAFTKVELRTTKIRLDWEVSTEALEDNIEGAGLEDHLVRLMTNAFANDIEDLAINGKSNAEDYSGNRFPQGVGNANSDPFLGILQGFVAQVAHTEHGDGSIAPYSGAWQNATDAKVAHEYVPDLDACNPYAWDGNDCLEWTPEVLENVIKSLPRKYRAIRNGLKFYASTETFSNIVKNNGTLEGNLWTSPNRQDWLNGNGQTLGPTRQTSVLGVPVLEVPYYPDNFVDLTFPQNRIWGLQRDIVVNREYKAKKDTIEYTVFIRFGIAWEELDAVAFAAQPSTFDAGTDSYTGADIDDVSGKFEYTVDAVAGP
jgi:hypothetical protein